MTKFMTDAEIVSLVNAFQDRVRRFVELRDPPGLDRKEISGWYAGPQADDRFWPPLYRGLQEESWVEDDLVGLDKASSKVLSRMSPPHAAAFKTRGLVLGHVQSGKTTNFSSVIAKSADAGAVQRGEPLAWRATDHHIYVLEVSNEFERLDFEVGSSKVCGVCGGCASLHLDG